MNTPLFYCLLFLTILLPASVRAEKPTYPPGAAAAAITSACEQARKESKLVFVKSGFPECGWCVVFDRFHDLPEAKEILGKYFVVTKIDTSYMPDGITVFSKFAEPGAPSWAIINPDQKVLITSYGPNGNVGFPGNPEEISYYQKALKKTVPAISEKELEILGTQLQNAKNKKAAPSSPAASTH